MKIIKSLFRKKQSKQDILGFNILGLNDDIRVEKSAEENMQHVIDSFIEFVNKTDVEIRNNYKDVGTRLLLLDSVLLQLSNLQDIGLNSSIYKKDYQHLKHLLFKLLTRLFGTIDSLDYLSTTLRRLESMDMIPKESEDDFVQMCPISRWE